MQGIILSLFSIGALIYLEGLKLGSLFSVGALTLIILGSFGIASSVFGIAGVINALSAGLSALFGARAAPELQAWVAEINENAALARKDGVLALDVLRDKMKNRFFKRWIKNVIDNVDPKSLAEILGAEIQSTEQKLLKPARVLGFLSQSAPILGVLGSAFGFLKAMAHLQDPNLLGTALGVSFLSVIYGLILSQFVFLPMAERVEADALLAMREAELARSGVIAIQEGLSPHALSEKLKSLSEVA